MSAASHRWRALFRRDQGVRMRSTIVGTALVTLALAIGAAVMLFMLHRADDRSMYDATGYRSYVVAEMIEASGVTQIPPEELAPGTGVDLLQIIDAQGTVVASSPGAPQHAVTALRPAPRESIGIDGQLVPGDDGTYCGTATGAHHAGSTYTVVTAVSSGPYRQSLINTALLLAIELPILVILSAVAIWFFTGRALRPVARITEQVTTITSSDLSQRVPVPSTDDEVTRLANTMNAMLARLDHSHEAQLRFVGDASHEMRSPLTTVVGILDLADDTDSAVDLPTVRTILLPEAHRLQQMLDDLLLLAKADERGVPLRLIDVDLDDIVAEEIRRLRSLGLARVEPTIRPIRVTGDPDKLSRALRNLTENAAHHTSSVIVMDMSADAEHATLIIGDDGPGIPEDQRERVFERFTRLDTDRRNQGGSGLGLSIVYEIVRAHGGTVRIGGPPPGHTHGSTFVVTLPISQDTASPNAESAGHTPAHDSSARDTSVHSAPGQPIR